MNIEYEDYTNGYEPTSVSWEYKKKKVKITFNESITAIYSDALKMVVVEEFKENKLKFFQLDGSLGFEKNIPEMRKYKFRGMNKNTKSATGISLLFHPIEDDVGNQWRDTEQYELDLDGKNVIGQKLGIFR